MFRGYDAAAHTRVPLRMKTKPAALTARLASRYGLVGKFTDRTKAPKMGAHEQAQPGPHQQPGTGQLTTNIILWYAPRVKSEFGTLVPHAVAALHEFFKKRDQHCGGAKNTRS